MVLLVLLPENWEIVLVGTIDEKVERKNIVYIERTQNPLELAEIYSTANVLVSLSRSETFGLTVAESMACGTPAIVYDNTALPELISNETGAVISTCDVMGVASCLKRFEEKTQETSARCRERANKFFDKNKTYCSYISLYNNLLQS